MMIIIVMMVIIMIIVIITIAKTIKINTHNKHTFRSPSSTP